MKLEIKLSNPKSIEIVNNLPKEKRNEILEKYIILGDMVVSHASIITSKETVENFFSPLQQDIETIRKQLNLIVPTIATPVSKSKVNQESIFKSFEEHFINDAFEDVSVIGKFTDIKATISEAKTDVLIELKEYSGRVPSDEVEKFWRDMDRRNVKYGIFVSMRSPITKISGALKIETRLGRTGIFIVNSDLNWIGHIFAFYVVKKIIELENTKKKELKGEEIDKIISKVSEHINDIKKDSSTIEEIRSIADDLKTRTNNRLDKMIDLAAQYNKRLNDKLKEALEELEKVELE